MKTYHNPTTAPEPTGVHIIETGLEYIPEGIGGREYSVLRSPDGTMVKIYGREWGFDLEVEALTWQGYIPHPDQRDRTYMTRVRHTGSTHRQVRAWWMAELAELAALTREGAAA